MGLLNKISLKTIQPMVIGTVLAAAALLSSAPDANATFVLATGNSGNLGDNVIVNNCVGNTVGAAALVQGCLNTSHTTLLDVSTTSGNLLANGGQARFDASGGDVTNFTINFDDSSLGFSGIVFNIDAEHKTTSTVSFTLNAIDSLGNVEAPQLFSGSIDSKGNNFFNLISSDGEVATSLTVSSTLANIVDVAQIRIVAADIPLPPPCTTCGPPPCTENCGPPCTENCNGNGPPPSVPEPASLFLLGSALLGYGATRRKAA